MQKVKVAKKFFNKRFHTTKKRILMFNNTENFWKIIFKTWGNFPDIYSGFIFLIFTIWYYSEFFGNSCFNTFFIRLNTPDCIFQLYFFDLLTYWSFPLGFPLIVGFSPAYIHGLKSQGKASVKLTFLINNMLVYRVSKLTLLNLFKLFVHTQKCFLTGTTNPTLLW